jgi:hypothetical protein
MNRRQKGPCFDSASCACYNGCLTASHNQEGQTCQFFGDSQQFYATVGELMDRAKQDAQIGPKIAKSGLVIQFRYTDPEALTTVNAKVRPTQPGAFVDVIHGPCDLKPGVKMTMKADIAHAFWHGRVNLLTALAKREIVAQGPLPKILKLQVRGYRQTERLSLLPLLNNVAVVGAVGLCPAADQSVFLG